MIIHSNESSVKNRKIYFDLLKIISCFLVIVNHTSVVFLNYSTSLSKNWITSSVIFYFSKGAVPIFIFITGALLLTKVDTFSYSLFKFKKIFLVLLGWSFFYWLQKAEPFTHLFNFFYLFFTDTISVHLWYLYMLLGFYLMLPFLQKLVHHSSKMELNYFLVIWFITSSLLPFLKTFGLWGWSSYFQLPLYSGFIGMFVLGYYLEEYREVSKIKWKSLFFLGLFSLGILVVHTAYFSFTNKELSMSLDNILLSPIVVMASCLFLGIKKLCTYPNFIDRVMKHKNAVLFTSKLSFSIYLLHQFIIDKLLGFSIIKQFLAEDVFNINVRYLILDIFIFVITFGILAFFSKIPLLKKIFFF